MADIRQILPGDFVSVEGFRDGEFFRVLAIGPEHIVLHVLEANQTDRPFIGAVTLGIAGRKLRRQINFALDFATDGSATAAQRELAANAARAFAEADYSAGAAALEAIAAAFGADVPDSIRRLVDALILALHELATTRH